VCSIVNKADLTVCCVCGSTKWNQVGGRAAEEALKLTVQQLLFKQKEAERKALELKALEPEAPGPEALEIAVVGDASSPAARLPTVIDDEQTFFVSQRDLFERETEGLLQAAIERANFERAAAERVAAGCAEGDAALGGDTVAQDGAAGGGACGDFGGRRRDGVSRAFTSWAGAAVAAPLLMLSLAYLLRLVVHASPARAAAAV